MLNIEEATGSRFTIIAVDRSNAAESMKKALTAKNAPDALMRFLTWFTGSREEAQDMFDDGHIEKGAGFLAFETDEHAYIILKG